MNKCISRHRSAGMALAGMAALLLCPGCGKKADQTATPPVSAETTNTAAREPRAAATDERTPLAALPASMPAPAETAAQDPGQVIQPQPRDATQGIDGQGGRQHEAIRVAAILEGQNDDVRVGLVSDAAGRHAIVGIGDSFLGYVVVSVDRSKGEVVLQSETERFSVSLKRRAPPSEESAPAALPMTPVPTAFSTENTQEIPVPESFIPTEDEQRRGIDPNNPETWPQGYRGPSIERAASQPQQNP